MNEKMSSETNALNWFEIPVTDNKAICYNFPCSSFQFPEKQLRSRAKIEYPIILSHFFRPAIPGLATAVLFF